MPRGRGGARQGTPGTAYGNRTDLNMPKSTVPNQEYGKAAMQERAQQAVPMGASPNAATQVAQNIPQPTPAPQALQATPGSLAFTGPTERPNEPIQAGLPSGPGPGPEIMAPPRRTLTDTLASMTLNPNANAAVFDMAASARALGL